MLEYSINALDRNGKEIKCGTMEVRNQANEKVLAIEIRRELLLGNSKIKDTNVVEYDQALSINSISLRGTCDDKNYYLEGLRKRDKLEILFGNETINRKKNKKKIKILSKRNIESYSFPFFLFQLFKSGYIVPSDSVGVFLTESVEFVNARHDIYRISEDKQVGNQIYTCDRISTLDADNGTSWKMSYLVDRRGMLIKLSTFSMMTTLKKDNDTFSKNIVDFYGADV